MQEEKQILRFTLDQIKCPGCANKIKQALCELSLGLKESDLTVDITNNTVEVRLDPLKDRNHAISNIETCLSQKGYKIISDKPKKESIVIYLILGIITSVTGTFLMIAHHLPHTIFCCFPILCASIAIPGIILTGFWIFKNAFEALFKQGDPWTMDVLFSLSLSVILISSLLNLFIPILGAPMLCHSGLMIVGFRNLGKFIDEWVKESGRSIDKGDIHFNKFGFTETELQKLKTGDTIKVNAATQKIIPIDGRMISGEATIDESSVNGELTAKAIKTGDLLWQGCPILSGGEITIQVTKTFEHSYYQSMQRHLRQQENRLSSIETASDKLISYYTPTLLCCAISIALLVAFFNPMQGVLTFIGILVGSCPCILGLISPLIAKFAINKAENFGVTIKDLAALEALANADLFIFDKTGTLTNVLSIQSSKDISTEWQAIIATLEQNNPHPIARALIAEFPNAKALDHYKKLDSQQNNGISGIVNDKTYHIGNKAYLENEGIKLDDNESQNDASQIYFSDDQTVLATFSIQSDLQPGAASLIQHLHHSKKQLVLLTGSDNQNEFKKLSQAFKFDHTKLNQTSADKLQYVKAQKDKCIAYIGDGDNDQLALKASHIGISFYNESQHHGAQSQASIILPPNRSFYALINLIELSRKTVKCIHQTTYLALTFAVGSVLLNLTFPFLMGFALNPGIVAALMFVQIAAVGVKLSLFKSDLFSVPNDKGTIYEHESTSSTFPNLITEIKNFFHFKWISGSNSKSLDHDLSSIDSCFRRNDGK